jgi:3-oxoacyl-[acyl-carrier protein] reductase
MFLNSVSGRSVMVTGASKGIGKGIARIFAKAGAKVLIVSRDTALGESAAEELRAEGGTASAFAGDVTQPGDMQAAAATAVARHGGLDILCANAGIFPLANLEEMTPETWDQVMATNLKGTFLAVRACLPHLKKSDQGRIVITSSITGPITGLPGLTHYGATKSGQLGFMRSASLEVAKYGITVNAVMPGNIVTEGLQGLGADYLKATAAAIPLRRLGGVDDIGHAVLFLASKEASYITGQTIIIDGGQTLPESLDSLTQV